MHHESRGPNSSARRNRQKVNGPLIISIQLDFRGHALLSNEHAEANRECFGQVALQGYSSDLHDDKLFTAAYRGFAGHFNLVGTSAPSRKA